MAAVREHPDRVPRGLLPAPDRRLHEPHRFRRRRLPPRRQRGREALRLSRAGRSVDSRRPLADPPVGRARRRAGRALGEDPQARRRDGGAAAVEVRQHPRRAGRHARLPDGGRRRLEGPTRPAGRSRRARRLLRARLCREGTRKLRRRPAAGWGRGRRRDRGRTGAAARGARRRALVRLRPGARRCALELQGGDRTRAAAAGDAAALVPARAG